VEDSTWDGRRALAVRVSDTGPGIPSEKRHLLFQEFGRLSRDHEGMGLGLAISCRLAHALGGDLTADSEAGHGSTFTLWLPLSRGGRADVHRVA
jgi:signal transduction histidine kinase